MGRSIIGVVGGDEEENSPQLLAVFSVGAQRGSIVAESHGSRRVRSAGSAGSGPGINPVTVVRPLASNIRERKKGGVESWDMNSACLNAVVVTQSPMVTHPCAERDGSQHHGCCTQILFGGRTSEYEAAVFDQYGGLSPSAAGKTTRTQFQALRAVLVQGVDVRWMLSPAASFQYGENVTIENSLDELIHHFKLRGTGRESVVALQAVEVPEVYIVAVSAPPRRQNSRLGGLRAIVIEWHRQLRQLALALVRSEMVELRSVGKVKWRDADSVADTWRRLSRNFQGQILAEKLLYALWG
ncbi:hypothetical protein B0H11DRAFT_1939495 [Mycena galericulata]|nr:hypothetical protein B0H11DRAFT_1939495 [Mycena galericulata]